MPLGKRADFQDAKYAGVEVEFVSDIAEALPVRTCKRLFRVCSQGPSDGTST